LKGSKVNAPSVIGDNNPPDPIDEALAPYGDYIAEAEQWLDGAEVESEGQMKAVDDLTRHIKSALKDVNAGEKSAAAPLHDAWKAEKARWKPTIDDLTRIRDGLVSAVSAFKKKLADEKAVQERAAWEAADKARREAEEKAAQAASSDIDAQREAAAAKQAAQDAIKAAKAQQSEAPKGMRKVTRYEITDHREALHWIAQNDRDEITAFIEEYVRRNHKKKTMKGVRVWEEKEAF
jgi:hypothetical protein